MSGVLVCILKMASAPSSALEYRKCSALGCSARMGRITMDGHMLCVSCRGCECREFIKCSECKDWQDDRFERYLKYMEPQRRDVI